MNEAVMTNSTADDDLLDSGFDCHQRDRATLMAASLRELCVAAKLQWAVAGAGLHPTCQDVDDSFVDTMCAADEVLLKYIAGRPSITLADVAAKAELLRARLRIDVSGDSGTDLLTESVLADVAALAAREAGFAPSV
jgi:hypothetical protein